jgi:hypothetical protein
MVIRESTARTPDQDLDVLDSLVGPWSGKHLGQHPAQAQGDPGTNDRPDNSRHVLRLPSRAPPPGNDDQRENKQPGTDWGEDALVVGRHEAVTPWRLPGEPVHVQVPAFVQHNHVSPNEC